MSESRLCTAGLLAAGLLLSACASGGAATADAATTTLLRRDMTTLVAAAASKNYAAAGVALTVLNADVQAASSAGQLSDTQLARIRAAEANVRTDLASAPARTVSATPSLTPTPAPTPVVIVTPRTKPGKPGHKGEKSSGHPHH